MFSLNNMKRIMILPMKSPCNNWLLQFRKHLMFTLAFKHHQKLFIATFVIPIRALVFKYFYFYAKTWKETRINLKKSRWGSAQIPTVHESTVSTCSFINCYSSISGTAQIKSPPWLSSMLNNGWSLQQGSDHGFLTATCAAPLLHTLS